MKRLLILLLVSLFVGSFAAPALAGGKGGAADKEFVTKAALGGLMEVQLGQMAADKGTSQEVKDFGKRMVADHGKANDELKALAQKKNMTLPTELDKKHKEKVDKLTKASGADFDKQYMRHMVKAHAKDVTQFQNAAKSLKDPDLKAWATKTLPALEEHMQQATALAKKLGVDVSEAEKEGREAAKKK